MTTYTRLDKMLQRSGIAKSSRIRRKLRKSVWGGKGIVGRATRSKMALAAMDKRGGDASEYHRLKPERDPWSVHMEKQAGKDTFKRGTFAERQHGKKREGREVISGSGRVRYWKKMSKSQKRRDRGRTIDKGRGIAKRSRYAKDARGISSSKQWTRSMNSRMNRY